MIPYDSAFYELQSTYSSASARQVVPCLMSLFNPRSVVDVGCGTGIWAAEFRRQGLSDVTGIDGAYVARSQLRIPQSSFFDRDLEAPIVFGRTFDLAICLEVAEHLSARRAASFVEDLIGLAPVIVFSAAIPCQGGQHHINERWGSYWHHLFSTRGFVAIDCLRPRFWENTAVGYWYRQNMMVYVPKDRLEAFAPLVGTMPLDVVHPGLFQVKSAEPSLRFLLRKIPGAVRWAVKSRLLRMFGTYGNGHGKQQMSSHM